METFNIEDLNLVVEIKSSHFWKLSYENNIEKKCAAEDKYYYVLVLDNDFTGEIYDHIQKLL